MGMDVYGISPKSEKGEYFRNNVWWWRPLWDYVCEVEPKCLEISGHYNDGDGIKNAEGAIDLANKLLAEITSGRTATYAKEREEFLNAIPDVTCEVCNGSGWIVPKSDAQNAEFLDYVQGMVNSGQVVSVSGDEGDFMEAMKQGVQAQIKEPKKCGGCEGKGERRPWDTHYPFSVENVQEFADFLLDSGGFEIC